jgi:hypothetical protein
MNFCTPIYAFVTSISQVWSSWWGTVSRMISGCTAQPCTWWCLCCNVWLCWVLVIVVAVLFAVLLVIYTVVAVLLVPVCWAVCLVFALLLALDRSPVPNCFASDAPAPTPPPAPTPTVTIDQPADGALIPDGNVVPIAFSATATGADGTPIVNADIRWEIDFGPNSPSIPLGNGASISATLPHRQADIDAGRTSRHRVRATLVVPGAAGASAAINVDVGAVIN